MATANDLYFEQTKLTAFGKTGKIEPDKDGYYTLVAGALNVYNNSKSWYYTAEGAKELFGPGSLLHRKIANGCLNGEVNHPHQKPGEKTEAFMNRMLDIDLNNVCCHFRAVWLDFEFGKKHPEYNNPDMIAIMVEVKPSGAKGYMLKEALENQHQNVCFSIRSLAKETMVRGKVIRQLLELVTIDWVNEGGVLVASKWDSPATETISNTPVIQRVLENCSSKNEKNRAFALESAVVADYILDRYFQKKPNAIYRGW